MENIKILVADDERAVHSYLQRKLAKLGYTVHVAEDGEEALKKVLKHLPDIILLDVKMPKMDGIEVCRRIRSDSKTSDIPVIILSAKAQAEEIQEGLSAGANKYLCKPISFPRLLQEVKSILERKGK